MSDVNKLKEMSTTVHDAGVTSPEAGSDTSAHADITLGEQFEIILKSNPHNGYMWYYVGDEKIHAAFALLGEEMQPMPRYAGTRQHFFFRADVTGENTITFVYKRNWETKSYATFTMHMTVN